MINDDLYITNTYRSYGKLYLLLAQKTREVALIDPGKMLKLYSTIFMQEISNSHVLVTHCHRIM